MAKLKITDTTLRDAHQSLWATRMTTADMLPIITKIDEVGYNALEVWGGATFDVCYRYLDEDPWERLRILKREIKKTPLQMLLRGQSLVGYQLYPDDVVEAFIKLAVKNGIDIIRIFDALNDISNMEYPIKVAKTAGAQVQGTVVYTISPVHTNESYLEMALALEKMGVDSICLKDMAGLLAPFAAFELVELLKSQITVPIELHSHYIGGLALGAYLEGVRAGVDIVDTAALPLAFGASQPPVETMVRAVAGTPYDSGLDLHLLFEIAEYFDDLRRKLGYERAVTRIADMKVFEHQVPGGMISNLISQLKEQNALARLDEVLAEIPTVRADLGYPPLVTPTSQIVGTQAVFNVLLGERYKMIPQEVKNYIRGLYGHPPAEINPEVRKKAIGEEEPIQGRAADFLEPRLAAAREEISDLAQSEEDILGYALFPQVVRKFLLNRKEGKLQPGRRPAAEEKKPKGDEVDMELNQVAQIIKALEEADVSEFNLEKEGTKLSVKRGLKLAAPVEEKTVLTKEEQVTTEKEEKGVSRQEVSGREIVEVKSPMVGVFYSAPEPDAPPFVQVGTRVQKGQTLGIIEAMKLMNEITSEISGRVVKVLVENSQPVEYGQVLFHIEKE